METLTAKIVGVVFSNKNNGFHVLKCKKNDGKILRVCGTFPGVQISQDLNAKFSGQFETHSNYGLQFTATSCEVIPESGRKGIITYITSNINSVGLITASKLYDTFGDDLVKILDEDPERIRSLSFLTKRQADAIIDEWSMANESRNSSIYFSNLGLNGAQIKSVLSLYGVKAREVIKNNPYDLINCTGIGFGLADQIARQLGIGVDDPRRIKSFVLFVINELVYSEGHMYVTSQQVMSSSNQRLFKRHNIESFSHGDFLTESQYYSALRLLIDSGDVIINNELIYPKKSWEYEHKIALHIAKSLSSNPIKFDDLDSFIKEYEKSSGVSLSDDQKKAFFLLNESRVITISGYPGTGKTTLVSAFVSLFEKYNYDFSLLSPTGIAAKRLSQVTGRVSTTIHRALGCKKDGSWAFNSSNKFYTDAVIVDEMSMVDSSTFHHLLDALDPSTILVMVGDPAQLPSVGSGFVFHNLLKCSDIPNVSMTHIFRQGNTSDIINVAHKILKNEEIDLSLNKNSEFVFISLDESSVVKEICSLSSKLKELNKNFQVISPMHDGTLGVNNLNLELRPVLNPIYNNKYTVSIKHGETGLYEGDRVIVIKNDYEKMVFNGDVGKITKINIKDDKVDVKVFDWFDQESTTPKYIDKVITFTIEEARSMLKVAYAHTIHRSQGKEIDYIIIPMTNQFGNMLYKNLIYTAITRAKKKVFIFGNQSAFISAVNNDRETIRNSQLDSMIHDYYEIECASSVMNS